MIYDFIYLAPGKRPLSSVSCTFLLRDGVIQLVLATSPGSFSRHAMITSTLQVNPFFVWEEKPSKLPTFQMIVDNVMGFSLDQSENIKRFHHQLVPNRVYVEKSFSSDMIAYLRSYGHEVEELDEPFFLGLVQAIYHQEDGWLSAVSDPRRFNKPVGY